MPLLPVFNERSDFDVQVTLKDADGVALASVTVAYYHLYDDTNGETVKDWTEFTVAVTGIGTISLAADDLEIGDDSNDYEERILTIQAAYGGLGKKFHEEYRFRLKNLRVVPKVSSSPSASPSASPS